MSQPDPGAVPSVTEGGTPRGQHADVQQILLTEEQILGRVRELGAQLTRDYAGREPVLVSVLKGSIVFLAT